MRTTIVDTLASIVFFTTVAALTELFVAGMEPREVLTTRLIMVPLMLVTGRPFGIYRDWVFANTAPTSGWSRALVDVFAFLTFQLPVYAATLFVAGASLAQIATLLPATALLMALLSRPYGVYLETVRKVFGTQKA